MINLNVPQAQELNPRIVVIGVGGAGGNAVNNMIEAKLQGVDFVVANTDAQALALSKADRKIQLGSHITQGLGAGMRPHVGEQAAEDSMPEILEHLEGVHMLFIAAGMGGGTGTGAAPVIARAAREKGILTVAVVTKPFHFEGSRRMKLAEEGVERLGPEADTLIVIPNQNLFRVATESTTIMDAFSMADDVLHSGVRGVTDLMVVPGLMNLDFADVRTVMDEMGKAMMGTGEASGERRAVEAAQTAITNPLLDDVSLKGAKGVLINITGGRDLTLYEVDEAANLIRSEVDSDANIIVGSTMDEDLEGIVRVSVVATGVEADEVAHWQNRAESLSAQTAQVRRNMERTAAPVRTSAPEPVATEASGYELTEAEIAAAVARDEYAEFVDSEEDMIVVEAEDDAYDHYDDTEAEVVEVEAAPQVSSPGPASEPEKPNVIRRPFSLFGRKKSAPKKAAPVPAAPAPQPESKDTGDLFGDDYEDELEIPAFLRRQAN